MHLNQNQNEESVDELLQKLAKKGKKVKLLDESASVKELPRQEAAEDFDQGSDEDINRREVHIDEDNINKSSVKKRMNKIKEERTDDESA